MLFLVGTNLENLILKIMFGSSKELNLRDIFDSSNMK